MAGDIGTTLVTQGGRTLTVARFELVLNTPIKQMEDNIRHSSSLNIPWLKEEPEHDRRVLICGAGPSLVDTLPDILRERDKGTYIVALNGTGNWLAERGVTPDAMVMIDCSGMYLSHVMGFPADRYYLASQVSPGVFSHLETKDVTLFHIDIENITELVTDKTKSILAVGGGISAGLIAMSLMYTQGYRDIHLHGYDSSYREGGKGHVYNQPESIATDVVVYGRRFTSTPWMVHQVQQWQELARVLREAGCKITVHGTGLLPFVAWTNSLIENNPEYLGEQGE